MEIIGRGCYGTVAVCETDPECVVKSIRLSGASRIEMPDVLPRLDHSNLAKVFEVSLDGDMIRIRMKKYLGDVQQHIDSTTRALTQGETDRFELQVGSALEYLHSRDVLHADVKPDNVLLDGDTNFYLTDFSLSMSLQKDTLRHVDQIYALFYRPPVLFYNTAGHVPIPEYDYYALFLTLCFRSAAA